MEIAKPIFKEPAENHTDFIARMSTTKTIDKYKEMLEELFLVRNPKFKFIPDHETEFVSFLKERNKFCFVVWDKFKLWITNKKQLFKHFFVFIDRFCG